MHAIDMHEMYVGDCSSCLPPLFIIFYDMKRQKSSLFLLSSSIDVIVVILECSMKHKLFLSHLLLLLHASFSIEIAIFIALCQKFQKLINFSSSNGNFIPCSSTPPPHVLLKLKIFHIL